MYLWILQVRGPIYNFNQSLIIFLSILDELFLLFNSQCPIPLTFYMIFIVKIKNTSTRADQNIKCACLNS